MIRVCWVSSMVLCLAAGAATVRGAEAGAVPPEGVTSVTARVGNIEVRFDRRKAWNLNRIDFKGVRLGIDAPGAHYGTVFKFPGVGFIGSGHTENESEAVEQVQFVADGQLAPVEKDAEFAAGVFKMVRTSRVRDFAVENAVEVKDDRVREQVTVRTDKEVPLDLVYHFMHPWTVTATEYLAGGAGKPEVTGVFADTKDFHVKQDLDWVAEYDAPSGKGLVSRLLRKPEIGGATVLLWDVPKTYRKFYLRCFTAQKVPAGFAGTYEMVTGFFEAEPASWKDAARQLATDLASKAK